MPYVLSGAVMPSPTQFSITLITALCLTGTAFAAPPTMDNADVLAEKIEDKLSDHKVDIAKSSARLKRKLDNAQSDADGDVSEEIDVMMDVLEEAFADDGLFRNLATMFSDIAEDIDIDTDNGTTTLSFDGATVGQIEHEKSRDSEDRISIVGLGKYFTLDRETIVEDGKTKTRIVIDMDGEDEIDITLPKLD